MPTCAQSMRLSIQSRLTHTSTLVVRNLTRSLYLPRPVQAHLPHRYGTNASSSLPPHHHTSVTGIVNETGQLHTHSFTHKQARKVPKAVEMKKKMLKRGNKETTRRNAMFSFFFFCFETQWTVRSGSGSK